MVPFESLDAVSYSLCIVTMALSCISFEIKRYIGRKSWFIIPLLHSTPPFGVERLEWWRNFEDMYNRLDTMPACDRQTDGQRDRRTDILPRHSPRYACATRGKNWGQDGRGANNETGKASRRGKWGGVSPSPSDTMVWGRVVSSPRAPPARYWAEPRSKTDLVHCTAIRKSLTATILLTSNCNFT